MRSDLHTLWDLNLIAIEPKSRRVYIAPQLAGTSYEKIAGRTLGQGRDGLAVNNAVLAERWQIFASTHGEETPRAKGDTTLQQSGEVELPARVAATAGATKD